MKDIFHIEEGTVGVVSICNNSQGTNLVVLTKDRRYRATLCVGNTITIGINTRDSFSITHLPTSKETEYAPSNFVVTTNERTTHIPFVEGEGSASVFAVTIHNGTAIIDASTIVTIPKEIYTDFIHEELLPGEKVCVMIG